MKTQIKLETLLLPLIQIYAFSYIRLGFPGFRQNSPEGGGNAPEAVW